MSASVTVFRLSIDATWIFNSGDGAESMVVVAPQAEKH